MNIRTDSERTETAKPRPRAPLNLLAVTVAIPYVAGWAYCWQHAGMAPIYGYQVGWACALIAGGLIVLARRKNTPNAGPTPNALAEEAEELTQCKATHTHARHEQAVGRKS